VEVVAPQQPPINRRELPGKGKVCVNAYLLAMSLFQTLLFAWANRPKFAGCTTCPSTIRVVLNSGNKRKRLFAVFFFYFFEQKSNGCL
jgi:hypothetical protein